MYDSGITAKSLISAVKDEADISPVIDDNVLIGVINDIEQLVYKTLLRKSELYKVEISETEDATSETYELVTDDIGNTVITLKNIIFDDVVSIDTIPHYGHKTALLRVETASAELFRNIYCKGSDNSVKCHINAPLADVLKEINVYMLELPTLKTIDNYTNENIMLPIEHIEMLKCRMRAQTFMLCNEFPVAANWISMYNTLFSTFQDWCSMQNKALGV